MKPKKILLVDDEPLVLELLEYLLGPHYELIQATSFELARAQFESHLPDLVITDVVLPDGSGLELVKVCRALETEAKFLVISGNTATMDDQKLASLGIDAFVSKPFKLKSMLEAVAQLL